MALCLKLGGSLSFPSSSYDEIIQQGKKQDCPTISIGVRIIQKV